MPRLTDYLPVKLVEEKPWGPSQLGDRVYDEKFGILQAPLQPFADMEFYRRRCAIRGRGVVVAYLDIDKFKDFNRAYLETKVDHLVLPRFMEAVEAHVYAHGFAYRYGGDEYALLLPNMDAELAAAFLNQLRRKVGEVEYPGTDKKTTVSIGFVLVGLDSHLTDREALRLANQAKNHAKQGGRDRLATYVGDLFRQEDLRFLARQGNVAARRSRRS
ncbi:MAG TPA: GGDEF domain-containing protein [Pyrinomonadaceae bacterium]